jgi:hypothetical protein
MVVKYTFCAPILSCSSRTICDIFSRTRAANGSQQYMPEAVWEIIPARSINLWETICASAGVSFNVGAKNLENSKDNPQLKYDIVTNQLKIKQS